MENRVSGGKRGISGEKMWIMWITRCISRFSLNIGFVGGDKKWGNFGQNDVDNVDK